MSDINVFCYTVFNKQCTPPSKKNLWDYCIMNYATTLNK